jgi:hypothetical protein
LENFAFTISLNDLVTGPAKRMQSALVSQQKGLLASSKSVLGLEKGIAGLEAAMVRSAAKMDFKGYAKQSYELDAMKAALDRADKSELQLAKDLGKQASAIGESIKKMEAWSGVVAAGTEIALKAGEAIGDVAKEGVAFTISAVQQKQAALSLFEAMAGGKKAGDQLFQMMEELATELPQTKDQLEAWSKEFMAMGILKQDALRTQLKATAASAALMGEEGTESFTMLSRKIQESVATTGKLKLAEKQLTSLAKTGVNVTDVAKQMGISTVALQAKLKAGTVSAQAFGDALNKSLIEKGAGPLNRLSGSTAALGKKFEEAIGDIFEDVDISPFIDGMKDLLGAFGQGTESGKALKTILGGFFTGLFVWLGKAVTLSKTLFLGMIIMGLKAYIAIKPFIPTLKLLAAVVLAAGLAFGATFIPALVAGAAAGAMALGSLAVSAFLAAAPFLLIGAAVVGAGLLLYKFWDDIKAFGTEAIKIGENIVSGLISGLVGGIGRVVDAAKNLAHKAIGAAKGVLGIASDSKQFIKIGGYSGSGMVTGLKRSADNVASAAEGVGKAAIGGTRGAISASDYAPEKSDAAPKAGASGKKLSVTVEKGAIVINGASGVLELTEQALALLLEKVALAEGLMGDAAG